MDDDLKKLELEQQYEIRRMELTVEFAKFGFRGTLLSALVGMGVLVVLAMLAAWTKIENGMLMVLGFAVVLAVGVIAFGYFSLFKLPEIGLEWRDRFKGSLGPGGKS